MEKKDAKIEYELNSLSNGALPDPDKILWKARVQMRKDARGEKTPAPAKKREVRKGWIFAAFGAVAAVFIVLVIGIGVAKLFPSWKSSNSGSDSSFSPSPAPEWSGKTYSASQLTARTATHAEASAVFLAARGETFPVPDTGENENGMFVATLGITVFRTRETGKDVLIECKLRIMGELGADELIMRFELTQDVYEDSKEYLKLPKHGDLRYEEGRENGEYVSRAYIADKYRCMLQVMNGKDYRLDYYLAALFGESK